jgi:penicillin-binding protein 1B
MMKQTLVSGTARTAAKLGFTLAAAGKTGTTNDKKDAWFVGFTPEHVALTWIGYDDNTPLGLTGATGALPIWVQYMKNYSSKLSGQEFHWPEGTQTASFLPDAHLEKPIQPVTLVFKQALAPK